MRCLIEKLCGILGNALLKCSPDPTLYTAGTLTGEKVTSVLVAAGTLTGEKVTSVLVAADVCVLRTHTSIHLEPSLQFI